MVLGGDVRDFYLHVADIWGRHMLCSPSNLVQVPRIPGQSTVNSAQKVQAQTIHPYPYRPGPVNDPKSCPSSSSSANSGGGT